LAFAEHSKWEEAEEGFREALQADGTFAPAHNNLGLVLLQKGNLYEAAVQLRAATKLSPRAAEPLLNLARLYNAIGWKHAAISELKKAMELEPAEGQWRFAELDARIDREGGDSGPLQAGLGRETNEPSCPRAVVQKREAEITRREGGAQ
jgi:tetratricopeptide (TPR) repeat protein